MATVLAVGDDVDVDLDRVLQVPVDQDRARDREARAASAMKLCTSSAEWTIRIARPPST